LYSLLTLALAAALSAGLTYRFIQWLVPRDIVAHPNSRTMHKGVVPTGGGAPLLASALIATLAFWPLVDGYAVLIACLVVLAAISFADDVSTVPPVARLIAHFSAAAACVMALPETTFVFGGAFPLILDRAIAGIALAWFINLYNFMDGIDGIAGSETIAISIGYVLVTLLAGSNGPLDGIALACAGAAAGFLVWNWHPARVFLGDVGSIPLGFLMGWLMIDLAARVSLAPAIILPLYFMADATLTLARRVMRGERPWRPHREHFYQRAAQALGSHSAVVVRMWACNLVLIVAALASVADPFTGLLLGLAAVVGMLIHFEIVANRGAAEDGDG